MMIITKKLGPTNTKGTRISASAGGRKIVMAYNYELSTFDNHHRVAGLMASGLGWNSLAWGQSPDNTGFVFVNGATSNPV